MPLYKNPSLIQQRQDAISDLIKRGFENPLVNDNDLVGLFEKYSAQTTKFEHTGVNDISPALQAEIDTADTYAVFLQTDIDPDPEVTVTVQESIDITLQSFSS